MAALLASQSCCYASETSRTTKAIGFSSSLENPLTVESTHSFLTKSKRFRIEMRQSETPSKPGINGRSVKMVPSSEVVKRKDGVNNVNKVNGSAGKVVNGSSLVTSRRNMNGSAASSSTLVKPPTKQRTESFLPPPVEGVRVLPSDEGFSWADENYSSFQRSVDVWSFVLALRIRVLFDNAKWAYIGGFTEEKQKSRRRETASWLRESVLQLGPTFIKLGQLSSTRSDLFPREFVDELSKLQDRVPAFSPEKARRFIETELGAPISVMYKEFEDQPIAAASLGQVCDYNYPTSLYTLYLLLNPFYIIDVCILIFLKFYSIRYTELCCTMERKWL